MMAKYILFDTETTGGLQEDRIIQIGVMVVHSKNQLEVYNELCKSEVPIKLEAMEVHNIVPNMLEDKSSFLETMSKKKIDEYNLKENYLIAHNIKFDLSMLEKEGFVNQYTLIDTLQCAKHLYDELPYHRLQYLRYALELYKLEEQEAKRLNIEVKAHDAIGDVLIMKLFLSELVKKVKEKFPDVNPMEELAKLTEQPAKLKIFRFGKYKGQNISQIAQDDMGYLQWMRNNMSELDEDLKYTLDYYLQN